jgi:hypothetical protein
LRSFCTDDRATIFQIGEELRRRVADVDGFGDWLNRIEATLQALERQLAAIDTEIAVMRTTLAAKRLGEPQRLTESERR